VKMSFYFVFLCMLLAFLFFEKLSFLFFFLALHFLTFAYAFDRYETLKKLY
ncbi:membrane protein, partial [Campylobacter coli]